MKKLTKNIILLEGPSFQFPYCHCLWIEDELGCLIDSSPTESGIELLQRKKIDIIINTHGHLDHCFCNADFPYAQVYLHENDHPLVASGEYFLQDFGFDLFKDDELKSVYLQAIKYRIRPANHKITDGQTLELGRNKVEVLFLPGHSAGHCGFIFPDEGFIFTGDIDLGNFPWYANVNSNVNDFISSIEKVLSIKPEAIITGHGIGFVSKNISELLLKYRDIIIFREIEIVKILLQGKKTVKEIADSIPIYKKLPQPARVFYLYECMMILKHLEHLMQINKVECENGNYYVKDGVKPYNINII